jgi:hypothetical protein
MTLEERFNLLLFRVKPEYAEKVRALLLRHPLAIISDEESINKSPYGGVNKAATIEGHLYIRVEKIAECDLDYVILHELIHMFVEERDGIKWKDLQPNPHNQADTLRANLLYDKIENDVDNLLKPEAARLGIKYRDDTAASTSLGSRASAYMTALKRQSGDLFWWAK